MRSTLVLCIVALGILDNARALNPRLLPCDGNQLNKCQAEFNSDMQYPDNLGVKTYRELRTKIEGTFGVDKAYGLLSICNAFKEFKQCYTGDNLFSCVMNPYGLLTATNVDEQFSRQEAYGYVKVWNQLSYVCGAGFSTFSNAEDCASGIFSNQTAKLRDCDYNFDINVQLDPSQACEYVEIAANCYRMVFWEQCKRAELSFFGCQYERTGTQLNYPQCDQVACAFHKLI